MPGAQDIHGHDLLRAARGVVRQRAQVHDRRASSGRPPDGGQIQEVGTLQPVKASHLKAPGPQEGRYRRTHMPAMPSDQNTHPGIIPADSHGGATTTLGPPQPRHQAVPRGARRDEARVAKTTVELR